MLPLMLPLPVPMAERTEGKAAVARAPPLLLWLRCGLGYAQERRRQPRRAVKLMPMWATAQPPSLGAPAKLAPLLAVGLPVSNVYLPQSPGMTGLIYIGSYCC